MEAQQGERHKTAGRAARLGGGVPAGSTGGSLVALYQEIARGIVCAPLWLDLPCRSLPENSHTALASPMCMWIVASPLRQQAHAAALGGTLFSDLYRTRLGGCLPPSPRNWASMCPGMGQGQRWALF